jgi:hypothetical protein
VNEMTEIAHLIPNRNKFTKDRYDDITQEDNHPTIEEISNFYEEVLINKNIPICCGDIINISSIKQDYNLYYFLARDGLELIGERNGKK